MSSVESRIAFPNEALSDHIIPNDIRIISINELKPNWPAAILFRFLSGIFSWNNWFTVRSNVKTAHRCRTIETNIIPRLLLVPKNDSTISYLVLRNPLLRYDSGKDFSWFSGQWSQKEDSLWPTVIFVGLDGPSSERYSEPGINNATTANINMVTCHSPAILPVDISPKRFTSKICVIGANIPNPADTMNKTLIDDSLTHDCLAYPDPVYISPIKQMWNYIILYYKRSFKHRRQC